MKRALLFLAACSGRSVVLPAPDAGPSLVTCETTSTCTLECNTPSTWTEVSCETVAKSACVDSHERGTAYGCALECGHAARVIDRCVNEDTQKAP